MEKLANSHFLFPSKLFVSTKPYDIVTVLGSCVAVCLYDVKRNIGGMNHYMLPLWNGKELASPKFGNIAINKLIRKMVDYGADQNDMVAKIFGGAEVIDAKHKLFQIGKKNIEVAHQVLNDEGIKILKESVGDKQGRKILFRTSTGEVFMRFVKRQSIVEPNEKNIA
jgi:chemotaxis protein CheD